MLTTFRGHDQTGEGFDMSNTTCCIHECGKPLFAKFLCSAHYTRLRRTGTTDFGWKPVHFPHVIVPTEKNICTVDGCDSFVKGFGYCVKHYQRFKKTGDPLATQSGRTKLTYIDGQLCAVGECSSLATKLGHCELHYRRLKTRGTTDAPVRIEDCLVSGCTGGNFGHGYCSKHRYRFVVTGDPLVVPSGRVIPGTYSECVVEGCEKKPQGAMCATHAHNLRKTGDPNKTPGPRVRSRPCALCGETMDLTALREGRQRATSSRRYCKSCRRDSNIVRHVPALVERDGTGCGICGETVNLELSHPDPLSRSVDHVIPRAHGGPDHIDNYSLAHLICNIRKGASLEYVA